MSVTTRLVTVETKLREIDTAQRRAYFDIISTLVITRVQTNYRYITSLYRVISEIVTAVYSIYTLDSPIRTAITQIVPTRYVRNIRTILASVWTQMAGAGQPAGGGTAGVPTTPPGVGPGERLPY